MSGSNSPARDLTGDADRQLAVTRDDDRQQFLRMREYVVCAAVADKPPPVMLEAPNDLRAICLHVAPTVCAHMGADFGVGKSSRAFIRLRP
jgi:hypothetical protein